MENLNAEQIIKALECCKTTSANDCEACEYEEKCLENGEYVGCVNLLVADALSLINELTEENERFRKQLDDRCDLCIETDNARTVRKMTELLIRRLPIISPSVFRGIAKEMLEGGNG